MSASAVEQIAGAIKEGFKLLATYMQGSEKRRMRRAVDYGERFIRRWEEMTPKSERDKKLKRLADDFFDYNN